MAGISLHIPFCESKCYYCAFSSFVKNDEWEKYFKILIEQILSSPYSVKVESIFIGGGTPSVVDKKYIEQILLAIKAKFDVADNVEITIEANPNSLDREKLEFYKKIGITRLSIGVQSLDNGMLKTLGRKHNKKQVFYALKEAKKAGFENINCDLLLGLEGQTYFKLKKEVDALKKYVTHFSCYMLQIEDGTLLEKMVLNGQIKLPLDDKTVTNYLKLTKYLHKNGFLQYEISNFAKKGYKCRHNLNYWTRGDYLGFGLSAHSFVNKKRWANANTFAKFYAEEKLFEEDLTDKQIVEEMIMLGLRCEEGVDKKKLKEQGYDIEQNQNYDRLIKTGIIFEEGDKIKINPDYYGASNLVIEQLF